MNFPEKTLLTKDGRRCLLRPAAPRDAAALIAYMKTTAGETHFLLRYPDEVCFTAAQENLVTVPFDFIGKAETNAVVRPEKDLNIQHIRIAGRLDIFTGNAGHRTCEPHLHETFITKAQLLHGIQPSLLKIENISGTMDNFHLIDFVKMDWSCI